MCVLTCDGKDTAFLRNTQIFFVFVCNKPQNVKKKQKDSKSPIWYANDLIVKSERHGGLGFNQSTSYDQVVFVEDEGLSGCDTPYGLLEM